MQHGFCERAIETAPREVLRGQQLRRLRALAAEILATNPFYRHKLQSAGLGSAEDVGSLDDVRHLPFTHKGELIADQAEHPPFGSNLTYPVERYVKVHQTSGTSGRPLRVLDTVESWAWWLRCWRFVFAGAGVGSGDRVFCAFSFGPFIGFWAGFECAPLVGAMAIPGGGQDSLQRLRAIEEQGATVLLSTPTYALRLAEVAREHGINTAASTIRRTIHAGEPGASVQATRRRIDEAWGAECHDHTGVSEVGATGFTCGERAGVHLIESEYLFEVIDPATNQPLPAGRRGELVITNFGRVGMPLIRYRTGDLAEVDEDFCSCGRTWARLRGGILGRVDDMVVVRGINVFPSSIEDIVRGFNAVAEFRLELFEKGEMRELTLTLEPIAHLPQESVAQLVREVCDEVHRRIQLRVACESVPPGTLPRFELKARRFFRRAHTHAGR